MLRIGFLVHLPLQTARAGCLQNVKVRQSAFVARESTFVARENTPMSDNLSKRRIHYAKNPNTMQILGLICVFCLVSCRISDIDVNLEAEIRNS